MEKQEWFKELKVEEFPSPYSEIANEIGIENTIKIMYMYEGISVYFPRSEGILNKIRNKKIREEFDGGNYKALAIKYKLTERRVRDIINDNQIDNQINIFDYIKSK